MKMRTDAVDNIAITSDAGLRPAAKHSYIVVMRLPDAQFFDANFGIGVAQQRLAPLKIRIDRSFKMEPSLDPKPDAQGVRWVSYTLRSDMTGAQAEAARKLGFLVNRDTRVGI
jgi:hypothetical protein